MSPFWKGEQVTGNFFGTHFEILRNKETLLTENTVLRQKLADLSTLSLERDALILENNQLKSLRSESSDGEVARILTNPSQSFYDLVTAEVTSNSQVIVGDIVFGPGNTVLGTVVDRSGTLVHIRFYSSAGIETLAQLAKNGTAIDLTGQGGGGFIFPAPRDLDIAVGDIVILPALKTSVLGTVQAVEPLRADSFKNVYISFPLNIFSLTFVRISHGH